MEETSRIGIFEEHSCEICFNHTQRKHISHIVFTIKVLFNHNVGAGDNNIVQVTIICKFKNMFVKNSFVGDDLVDKCEFFTCRIIALFFALKMKLLSLKCGIHNS